MKLASDLGSFGNNKGYILFLVWNKYSKNMRSHLEKTVSILVTRVHFMPSMGQSPEVPRDRKQNERHKTLFLKGF